MDKKEKIYGYICHSEYKPLTIQELCMVLDVPKADYGELKRLVEELVLEGKIIKNKKGRLKRASVQNILYGTLRLIKSGNGFVTLSNANQSEQLGDIFIDRNNVNYAFDGDTVSVKLLSRSRGLQGKSREGVIMKVIRHASDELVGTVMEKGHHMMFVADNMNDVFASISKESIDVSDGDKVIAKVVRFPDNIHAMKVCITQIIGRGDDVSTLISCIVREHKISEQFSAASLSQVQGIESFVTDEEKEGRKDFRADRVITIDGEDARDLDDAICVKKHSDGSFTLYVHIADVSHYVLENTAIDLDAYERATSVYLPDRVIPMLPRELSNGICSLNEGVDRLTISVEMQIDKNGNVYDYRLYEGLICSCHRMTYTDVTAIIEGNEPLSSKYKDICTDIFNMKELALLLKKRRQERGAIDFSFPEPKVVLDDRGSVAGVKTYQTGISNEIIEQFMLLANETVAKHAENNKLPFVYRVHEVPSEEKLTTLQKCLGIFGIPFLLNDASGVKPRDIQSVVSSIKGTPREAAIAVLCLRSMMKARYSPENLGHFGLASTYYCHFTSPIRRYPDLVIHRILRESMKREFSSKRKSYLTGFVDRAAVQSSENEVRAVDAERAADKVCACLYMEQFIGEEFDAVISSVTDFGLFVEIDGCIEGLVPMTQLCDDYYVYEEEFLRLRGQRGGRIFTLGDTLRVRLIDSNAQQRKIDFEVADMKPNRTDKKRSMQYKEVKNKKKKSAQKKDFKAFVKKKTKRKRR